MKKPKNSNQSGFTLIEAVIVIILMGILAVGLSLGLVKGIQNYVFANQATRLSQKGQIAMSRIQKELVDVTAISDKSDIKITYTRPYSPPSCQNAAGCQYTLQMSGNQILLQQETNAAQILIDNVSTFTLTFSDFSGNAWNLETGNTINNLAQIRVSLILTYGLNQNLTFNSTVNPRQGSDLNAPRIAPVI